MYLCVLKAIELLGTGKKKVKSKVGSSHGMTEGKNRRLANEACPVKSKVPIEIVIQRKVKKADESVWEQLQSTLEDFRDVFPD